MSDDGFLRQTARETIRTGKLPTRSPDGMWGGPGAGDQCAICGTAVNADQPELELEFTRDDDPAPARYHVHARCFAAWELERHHPTPTNRTTLPSGRRPSAAVASNREQRAMSTRDGTGDNFLQNDIVAINNGRRECGRPYKSKPA